MRKLDRSRVVAVAAGLLAALILTLAYGGARDREQEWTPMIGVMTPEHATASIQLPQKQYRHHIYQDEEADPYPYSCDFSFLPGAWTGDAAPASSPTIGRRHSGGSPLYGTAEAQAIIWAHQHPADCSSQRYLLHSPQASGIGSQLHVLGLALAVAMDTNRVLLMNTHVDEAMFTNDAYCGPERPNMDECYFERLTNCTLADMEASASITAAAAPTLNADNYASADVKVVAGHGGNVQLVGAAANNNSFAFWPKRLQRVVERSPVAPEKRYYWWRAQAAMYTVRPNARTRAKLAELRREKLQLRLPSQESAISVHIRHGDKWREEPEQPTPAYFDQAKIMHGASEGALHQQIFLSTDDPNAVAWFARNATGWDVSYTNSSRKPDKKRSTLDYARERGYATEYLDSLLNLELALECGGWVGTLSSNWCRLIDELRSTVRCKANGMYLDAGQGQPPYDTNWR